MKTKVLKPNKESIELACKLLRSGEVVGIPTETVYGLAGDSCRSDSIKKIFEAKGRPADNPLIVHIANMNMLEGVVAVVTEDAGKLAEAFWPGPLTMVMPKGDKICAETCAGLDSVGVRMPSNEIAREIIKKSGVMFSAPSANLSGRPSPTTAQDVFEDMNGRIPLIIDGGECAGGVESTVISMLGETPIILRPGIITKEDIENVLHKEVLIAKGVTEGVGESDMVLSPGMKYKHYSPKAEVILIRGSLNNFVNYVNQYVDDGVFVMCFDGEEGNFACRTISYGAENDGRAQAHNLFAVLRKFDEMGASTVYVRSPQTTGVSLAVYNRLIRSAGFRIIDVDK